MIKRIYLDNYKCFVNFDWKPGSLQLMVGENGAGKTTVFNVLETLREFIVSGLPTSEAFPASTLTAWDTRSEQTIGLELEGNGGEYRYQLTIEHNREQRKSRIESELLRHDQIVLYKYDGKDVHLHRDDGSAGPVYPFDWSRSAIPTIAPRPDNSRLTWFRERMERVYVFSPDPLRMTAQSDAELEKPDRRLHHLASWLRHLLQESVDLGTGLRDSLREGVLGGFQDFKLERAGETARTLKFDFDYSRDTNGSSARPFTLSFDKLSEGQRCLVALFTILHAAIDRDATVCVDEPDNFVALREIQPWLVRLRDRVMDGGGQCLLVSHHPELIDYLAAQHGQLFFREDAGPISVKPFGWTKDDAISPSEIVARGWE
ncbi:MAG: AAA family ATPase [Candidatus Nealsonbacteria bacterium]|nr:AAA family ATPase [Candidatus Nealsonbacteria bacterium]